MSRQTENRGSVDTSTVSLTKVNSTLKKSDNSPYKTT